MIINGYEYEYQPNHPRATKNGCVYKHILVAEEILGRYLKPEEVVHHMDENRSNNTKDNLIVFRTKSNHTRFHKTGLLFMMSDGTYISPIVVSKNKICPICGALKGHKSKICRECLKIKEKRNMPTKDKLKELLEMHKSREEIGRIYNVSGNTVKKWLIKYQLLVL